jgi:hypothetical protein
MTVALETEARSGVPIGITNLSKTFGEDEDIVTCTCRLPAVSVRDNITVASPACCVTT